MAVVGASFSSESKTRNGARAGGGDGFGGRIGTSILKWVTANGTQAAIATKDSNQMRWRVAAEARRLIRVADHANNHATAGTRTPVAARRKPSDEPRYVRAFMAGSF